MGEAKQGGGGGRGRRPRIGESCQTVEYSTKAKREKEAGGANKPSRFLQLVMLAAAAVEAGESLAGRDNAHPASKHPAHETQLEP